MGNEGHPVADEPREPVSLVGGGECMIYAELELAFSNLQGNWDRLFFCSCALASERQGKEMKTETSLSQVT